MSSQLRLSLLALLVCCGAIWSRAADPEKQIRVLFIGNSYTSTNDLPQMIEQLARAGRQPTLQHASLTPGGKTLQQHWEGGDAKKLISSQAWDFVVLQEQSTSPLSQPERTVEYARRLQDEIKPTGAKTILYLTWARQAKPETQTQLNNVYRKAAQETGALISPVGMAWAAALKDDPTLVLYNADGSHPSPAGTYLAACVFYAVLYQQSPEGLPPLDSGLRPAQAKKLQAIAWRTVQGVSRK
jgi:hypothetical protein